MRERFFCTVFDAVKAMLPAGLWFDNTGRRKVGDKTIEMAKLCLPPEEASAIAANKRLRSSAQANLLEMLCSFESLPSRELLQFSGASRQSLKALQKAGLVELYYREAYRRPEIHLGEIEPPPLLNEEQQKAFEGINALACSGKSGAALLFGITGSGKTSVYIHLIMEQLKRGKSAILLVPEISLTPQMIETFSSHFGDDVAVLHSSLSPGERYDEWKRIKAGKARLTIGTRSAVFSPAENLGIIIIEIPAVSVIDIAISVIVNAIARDFPCIHPDRTAKLRVSYVNPRINQRHNHLTFSTFRVIFLPCRDNIHIDPFQRTDRSIR